MRCERDYGRARGFSFAFLCLLLASSAACVKLPRRVSQAEGQSAPLASQVRTPLININTARAEELEKLPGIGPGLAARIISFREQFGRFRRPEHVMMVSGISERRFRALRTLITAE